MAKDKKAFADKSGFGKFFDGEQGAFSKDKIGGTVDSAMKVGATTVGIMDNINSADDMDERGNVSGRIDTVGNIASGFTTGMEVGGVWGGLAGGFLAGGASILGKNGMPSAEEQAQQEEEFQLGLQMKTIRPENTFAQQQPMPAKHGMNIIGGDKKVEVERDEVVLRKTGRAYKKVADFKGGKSHEQGGEDYLAQEGDVIIPGNKRGKVNMLLKNRRWSAIESMRMKLPTDTGQKEFALGGKTVKAGKYEKGTKGVKVNKNPIYDNSKWTPEAVDAYIKKKTVKGKKARITGKQLLEAANRNDFPIELALIQGAIESNFGTKGAGDWTNNIFNWGNVTEGDKKTKEEALKDGDRKVMDTIGQGVDIYMGKMKELYLRKVGKDWEQLLEPDKFRNGAGNRYADAKDYEETLTKELRDVKRVQQSHNVNLDGDLIIENIEKNKDKTTTTGGVPDFKDLTVEEQQKALKTDDARVKDIKDIKGFWHRGTAKGKLAKIPKQMNLPAGAALPKDYFNIGPRLLNLFGDDVNTDEVGFEETEEGYALEKEAEAIFDVMRGETSWWRAAASHIEGVDALRNKVLTGQSINAGMPAATGNMMAGLEPEEIDTILQEMKRQGTITDKGVQYANFVYNNPDKIHTTEMKFGLAVDVATLVANPKAVIKAAIGGGKLLWKGGKLTAKGVAALAKSKTWSKAWKVLSKDAPALAKKIGNNVVKSLSDDYKYAGSESLDDMLKSVATVSDDLADSGAKLTKENSAWVEKAKQAQTFIKSVPDRIRKMVTGNSIDEVNAMRKQVEDLTGKSFKQLQTMERADIDKLIKTNWDKKVKGVEDAITTYGDARKNHAQLGADLKAAQQELKAVKAGKADPIEIGKIEAKIAEYGDKLVEAEIAIEKAQDVSKMHFDEVARLEGFMDDPLYKDKFRVAMKLQQGVINQTKKLDQADGAVKDALHRETSMMQALEGLSDSKKTVRQKAIADMESANKARIANKAESLKDVHKAGGEVQAAKGRQAKFEQNVAKFPKIFKALEKDANALRDLKNGTLTWAQAANVVAQMERGEPDEALNTEIDSLRKDEADNIKTPEEKGADPTPPVDDGEETEVRSVKGTVTDYTPPTKDMDIVGQDGDEQGSGKEKKKIGDTAVGNAFETLAGYAPAIYNIVKGLQPADKVQRRFVTPQTKQYQNLSQSHINAIDDAFETAVGNARNLSGGMMSNFRSNVEKAWADKIKRRGEVNTAEAGRADAIASENISILNRADEFNTQVHAKADVMDMKSKAATKAFLGQGIADVANIASRNKKDRNAEKNQNMMLGYMQTGNFKFGKDGIQFIKPELPAELPAEKSTTVNPFKENVFTKELAQPDVNTDIRIGDDKDEVNWLNL